MWHKIIDNAGDLSLYVYKDARNRLAFEVPSKPIVSRMDLVIDQLTTDIPNVGFEGFTLYMREYIGSEDHPFLVLCHTEAVQHPYLGQSNWYNCEQLNRLRAWICPLLYKYIDHTLQALCLWITSIEQD